MNKKHVLLSNKKFDNKAYFHYPKKEITTKVISNNSQTPSPHNPKVDGSSPSPATKNFTRVARDCGLFYFCL